MKVERGTPGVESSRSPVKEQMGQYIGEEGEIEREIALAETWLERQVDRGC